MLQLFIIPPLPLSSLPLSFPLSSLSLPLLPPPTPSSLFSLAHTGGGRWSERWLRPDGSTDVVPLPGLRREKEPVRMTPKMCVTEAVIVIASETVTVIVTVAATARLFRTRLAGDFEAACVCGAARVGDWA
jgi:hypothetical protein